MWHTGRYDIHTDAFQPAGVATFGPGGKILRAETPELLRIAVAQENTRITVRRQEDHGATREPDR